MDNYLNKLPECLFDNILQYCDIKDIISFRNTSNENDIFVKKITTNKLSKVSRVYNVNDCCNIKTWIYLSKYDIKYVKQYYNIYKKIGIYFKLDFEEVKNIFFNLSFLIKHIYIFDKNIENNKNYRYIILTIFNFINDNCYILDNKFCEDIDNNIFKIKEKIMNVLFRIYDQELPFLSGDDFNHIENILIEIIEKLLNNISHMTMNDKYEYFIIEYLQLWFLRTQTHNTLFKRSYYLREMIRNILDENRIYILE